MYMMTNTLRKFTVTCRPPSRLQRVGYGLSGLQFSYARGCVVMLGHLGAALPVSKALEARDPQLPLLRQLLCRRQLDVSATMRCELDDGLGGFASINHKEQMESSTEVPVPRGARDPLVHCHVRRQQDEVITGEVA
jgi:hypothetical protein